VSGVGTKGRWLRNGVGSLAAWGSTSRRARASRRARMRMGGPHKERGGPGENAEAIGPGRLPSPGCLAARTAPRWGLYTARKGRAALCTRRDVGGHPAQPAAGAAGRRVGTTRLRYKAGRRWWLLNCAAALIFMRQARNSLHRCRRQGQAPLPPSARPHAQGPCSPLPFCCWLRRRADEAPTAPPGGSCSGARGSTALKWWWRRWCDTWGAPSAAAAPPPPPPPAPAGWPPPPPCCAPPPSAVSGRFLSFVIVALTALLITPSHFSLRAGW
jgi:hypothetical protein